MVRAQVTERTLYPPLMNVIKQLGGTSVSEVNFNSQPDIVFEKNGISWILSVKIGETIPILKSAFILVFLVPWTQQE